MDTESLTVETGVFNHTDVKPDFINPCCFGEDFAAWLRQQIVAHDPGLSLLKRLSHKPDTAGALQRARARLAGAAIDPGYSRHRRR
jgi:hypothetical protein